MNLFGKCVKFRLGRLDSVHPAEVQTEAVSGVTRDHVQVDVENFLARDLAVGKEQVHAVAWNHSAAKGLSEALRHAKHLRAGIGIESGKKTGVLVWNHEQMARIDGLDVENRRTQLVLVHETRRNLIRKNLTEDAVVHGCSGAPFNLTRP